MEDIANELLESIKWIPANERNTRWFKEYLDKVGFDLKLACELEDKN